MEDYKMEYERYDGVGAIQFEDTEIENEMYTKKVVEVEDMGLDAQLSWNQGRNFLMIVMELELRKDESQGVEFSRLCEKNHFDFRDVNWSDVLAKDGRFRQLLLKAFDRILKNNNENLFRQLFTTLINKCGTKLLKQLFIDEQFIIFRQSNGKPIKVGNFFFMSAFHLNAIGIYNFIISQFRKKFRGESLKQILTMKSEEGKTPFHTAAQRQNDKFLIANFKLFDNDVLNFRRLLTGDKDSYQNTVLHYLVISECVDTLQFLCDLMSHKNVETKRKYSPLIQRKDFYDRCQHFEYIHQVIDDQRCFFAVSKYKATELKRKHEPICRSKETIEVLQRIIMQCYENEKAGLVEIPTITEEDTQTVSTESLYPFSPLAKQSLPYCICVLVMAAVMLRQNYVYQHLKNKEK